MIVFAFAQHAHAVQFSGRFGGQSIDSKDRPAMV
jgi:hypothetical protein